VVVLSSPWVVSVARGVGRVNRDLARSGRRQGGAVCARRGVLAVWPVDIKPDGGSCEIMKHHGPKEKLEAAQSRDTPAAELGRLAQSEYVFVREAVAANPGTPGDVLASLLPAALSSEDDFRIARSLIRNTTLRPELASGVASLLVQAVARIGPRDFYPTELIDALVRCSVVPAESLLPLAEPESVPKYIRGRIAAPGARPEVLVKLREDPSEKVRSRARRAVEMSE
jgi:hypothetical protein